MTEHNPDGPAPESDPWAAANQGQPENREQSSSWTPADPRHPGAPERHPADPNPWSSASPPENPEPRPAEPNLWAPANPPENPEPRPADPNPWSSASPRGNPDPRLAEPVLFGTAFASGQGQPGTTSGYTLPPIPPRNVPPAPEKGRRGLVAGLVVLALIVGGGAGAAGGYLVADNRAAPSGPVTNALDQPRPASNTTAPAATGTVEGAAAKVLPSVVELQVRSRTAAGEGSGFVISSDGLIVTNNHVIAEAVDGGQIVAVFQDGKTASASVVGRDPNSDVAVVKAQGVSGLPVVDLGRSDDLRVGQGVVAIGSPFELTGTVTSGIVSALHRPTRAGGDQGDQTTVMDAIQTDAAINPGNSGGPLVDLQGRVIGINSAIYSPRSANSDAGSVGIGFAIPIDQARRTADEIAKTGKATQTVLGVQVTDNTPAGSGAKIQSVNPDGPAAKAGLQQGDVVTQLDGRRIDTSDALVAAVRAHNPGDTVKLVLGSRTVDVTLTGQTVG
ncbi:MAG TPA: trypsin-like peptidase domain-containing protein [Actinophytocola sp.]|jgi:putative serine protease PepD|uniref:S1C family serine protease n=1 Tax=Actinophytocola sp. TaxID=1872138 RepID=UPI002E007C4A|nr:trypsin-like peptidase domain-containing protein [Actinophytocola sp.]